jgi:hypothetical protein
VLYSSQGAVCVWPPRFGLLGVQLGTIPVSLQCGLLACHKTVLLTVYYADRLVCGFQCGLYGSATWGLRQSESAFVWAVDLGLLA